jgi:excisionase family DNA binding protein
MLDKIQNVADQSQRDVLTVDEVATYLKVSTGTVRKLAKVGELPYFTIGGSVRFSRRRLAAILKGKEPTQPLRTPRKIVGTGTS